MARAPISGATAPKQGTAWTGVPPGDALFAKTRRSLLALLYTRPDQAYHMRAISRATGAGQGAVQRELQRLAAAGILLRRIEGQQVYYQANRECPIFAELQGLVTKSVGAADVLRNALAGLADRIDLAFVYGSTARQATRAESDVDLLIVGAVSFAEVVSALRPAQDTLQREVNPSVYPRGEFRKKLAEGNHFLSTVTREPRIFLIGDRHELERLAA